MISVYVAGGSQDRLSVVRPIIERLRGHGVAIAHDWTVCEGYDRQSTDVERATWARQDIEGVRRADIVWYVAPNHPSEGSHAELGAAIVLLKHIIVSGPHASRESRIFALLATHRYDTHDDALMAIVVGAAAKRDRS